MGHWICSTCKEIQYVPEKLIREKYRCQICGNNKFYYEHNGIKHAMNKKKIMKASYEEE